MCLIFFALNEHKNYPLVLMANRDEFYERPALTAAYWSGFPHLLAGKDRTAGGTWLGVTSTGRFSALTNFRDLKNIKPHAPTRGNLTLDFLIGAKTATDYLKELQSEADAFNGFNLLCGSLTELYHYSNVSDRVTPIKKGVHGLSNALLDSPWPKVEAGKAELSGLLGQNVIEPQALFAIMANRQTFPDASLPDTGVGLEMERMLSAKFIASPKYGTRCTTVLLLHKSGMLYFAEKTFIPHSEKELWNEFRLKA